MLTRREKAYSSSYSRLLQGYRSLMPSCAGFLEPSKSRLGPSKSTFDAKNFIHSLSMSISIDFSAICSCNVSRSPKSPKKSIKALFQPSRSSKVIAFGCNQEPVYDFLLVINSNLGPISHRYSDLLAKICKFCPPSSHLVPLFGVTLFEFMLKLYGS